MNSMVQLFAAYGGGYIAYRMFDAIARQMGVKWT